MPPMSAPYVEDTGDKWFDIIVCTFMAFAALAPPCFCVYAAIPRDFDYWAFVRRLWELGVNDGLGKGTTGLMKALKTVYSQNFLPWLTYQKSRYVTFAADIVKMAQWIFSQPWFQSCFSVSKTWFHLCANNTSMLLDIVVIFYHYLRAVIHPYDKYFEHASNATYSLFTFAYQLIIFTIGFCFFVEVIFVRIRYFIRDIILDHYQLIWAYRYTILITILILTLTYLKIWAWHWRCIFNAARIGTKHFASQVWTNLYATASHPLNEEGLSGLLGSEAEEKERVKEKRDDIDDGSMSVAKLKKMRRNASLEMALLPEKKGGVKRKGRIMGSSAGQEVKDKH